MCRHVVGPLDIVDPAGICRREAIERARKIDPHIRIGIFLNDERRRGMPQEKEQRAVIRPRPE